jgi:hypothetical protein
LLNGIFGAAVASTLSWHSIRIGSACALHAVNCPDATIQLICRWASPDSLKLYRLIGTSSHIAWCDCAATATFDAVRVTSIPALDNSLDYAALAAPTPPSRARPRLVVAAAAACRLRTCASHALSAAPAAANWQPPRNSVGGPSSFLCGDLH